MLLANTRHVTLLPDEEFETLSVRFRTVGDATLTGAVEYRRPGDGITTRTRYDMQPWASAQLDVTAQRPITGAISLGVRASHASLMSADPVLPQRRLFAAGADPYQQMTNPFLRALGPTRVAGGVAGPQGP